MFQSISVTVIIMSTMVHSLQSTFLMRRSQGLKNLSFQSNLWTRKRLSVNHTHRYPASSISLSRLVCHQIKPSLSCLGVRMQNQPRKSILFLTSNDIHSSSSSNTKKESIDEEITTSNDPIQTKPMKLSSSEREERAKALHDQLIIIGIDAKDLANAAHQSLTSMEGFNPKYGKSTIKAYRTFIDPKPSKVESIRSEDVVVAASRCARQIDFLAKRNRSHEAEWVRHTDSVGSNQQHDDGHKSTFVHNERFPIIVLLDNVRSAFNVGSIFRTADACRCSYVFTTGITPSPSGRGKEKLSKSALGAELHVPSKHFVTTMEAIKYIKDEIKGWTIIGMETTDQSKCYTDVKYPGGGLYVKRRPETTREGDSQFILPKEGVVLVLGNEVTGVDTEIMPLLDLIVEIPMFGTKNSLNIAACVPVVLYEILRQFDAVNDKRLK
mmetsp:Transcript_18039/g.22084  ORF Transcript_18039/g.22084 Transcript_18039/m.22084 type:complete len:438 (+) Transcript_18039:152-1465(+)